MQSVEPAEKYILQGREDTCSHLAFTWKDVLLG